MPRGPGSGIRCSSDPCDPNPCDHEGTCASGDGVNIVCTCPITYTDATCETPVDPCQSNPCEAGTCTNNDPPTTYSCECFNGYRGSDCDVDVCAVDAPCLNGGSCIGEDRPIPLYSCHCAAGYTGYTCNTEVCASSPCQVIYPRSALQLLLRSSFLVSLVTHQGLRCFAPLCFQHGGSCNPVADHWQNPAAPAYTCSCAAGWTGPACGTDICAPLQGQPPPCLNGGVCGATFGTAYHCACNNHRYIGDHCETTVDACESDPCSHGACLSGDNSYEYSCVCEAGFRGDNCDVEACVSYYPCGDHGKCVPADNEDRYTCDCEAGWLGLDCGTDVCAAGPCMHSGECSRTNSSAHFHCACLVGFTGQLCDYDICTLGGTMANACGDHGSCQPERNFGTTDRTLHCACTQGWSGQQCDEDEDECVTQSPCQNGGACTNLDGHFDCDCPLPYFGTTCLLSYCQIGGGTANCQNGASLPGCQDPTGGGNPPWECLCPAGFSGELCTTNDNARPPPPPHTHRPPPVPPPPPAPTGPSTADPICIPDFCNACNGVVTEQENTNSRSCARSIRAFTTLLNIFAGSVRARADPPADFVLTKTVSASATRQACGPAVRAVCSTSAVGGASAEHCFVTLSHDRLPPVPGGPS